MSRSLGFTITVFLLAEVCLTSGLAHDCPKSTVRTPLWKERAPTESDVALTRDLPTLAALTTRLLSVYARQAETTLAVGASPNASLLRRHDLLQELARESPRPQRAELSGILLGDDGLLLDPNTCQLWYDNTCRSAAEADALLFPRFELLDTETRRVDNVISLAVLQRGSRTTGSTLTVGALVSLSHLSAHTFTEEQRFHLHCSARNEGAVREWLDVFNIPQNRLLVGDVAASRILLFESGDCGAPSRRQLQWLRAHLRAYLHGTHLLKAAVFPKHAAFTAMMAGLSDAHEAVVRDWTSAHHLMAEQYVAHVKFRHRASSFSAAAMLIVGASARDECFLFATAMPVGSCVVELVADDVTELRLMRLAFKLELKYVAVPRDATPAELTEALEICNKK